MGLWYNGAEGWCRATDGTEKDKTMNRYLFDQNVTQYFEFLKNEHCKMIKHDALYRYLHKRAIMYAYADRFINVLGIEKEKAFEMLLIDREEQEEYLRVRNLKDR